MSDSFAVFVLRRGVAAIAVCVAVSALTFLLLHGLTPESFDDRHALPIELVHYLVRIFVHADLGVSGTRPFRPVVDMLYEALPADVSMLVGSMLCGLVIGIAGGAICVRRPGGVVARLLEALAAVMLCAPVYVVGLLAILVFSPSVGAPIPVFIVKPNIYEPFSQNPLAWLRSLLVPWLVAGAPLAAMTLRMVRATLPEVLDLDFVRTAVGKGLSPRRVTVLHTLPVAIPPALSLAGAYTPMLLGNVILVEGVFGIPGVWRYIPGAISNGDFTLMQALVVVGAFFVVVANAVVDVTLAAIDPRVRA